MVVAGGNYGRNRLEGERCFASERCSSAGTVLSVATYLHVNGNCSVTGGVVYRGAAGVQALQLSVEDRARPPWGGPQSLSGARRVNRLAGRTTNRA